MLKNERMEVFSNLRLMRDNFEYDMHEGEEYQHRQKFNGLKGGSGQPERSTGIWCAR